ncbi:hypothetical protein LTR28_004743 [Elasticomyces elasticus]|nr:hypothetical protein LTR28_004743 [Elasticomyces elasticus]
MVKQEPTTPPPQSPMHGSLPLRPRQSSTSALDPLPQSPSILEPDTDVLATWALDPPPQAPSIPEPYTDALAAWAQDPLLQPLPVLESDTDVPTTWALDLLSQSSSILEPYTDVLAAWALDPLLQPLPVLESDTDVPTTWALDPLPQSSSILEPDTDMLTPLAIPDTTCEDLPCGHAAEMAFPEPQIITHIHTHSAAIWEFATRWENQYAGEYSFGARTIDRLSESIEWDIVTAAMSLQMRTQMHCPEGPFPGGFPQMLRTVVRYFTVAIRCLLHIFHFDSFFMGEVCFDEVALGLFEELRQLELALRRIVGWVEEIVNVFDIEVFEWS